jgi:hypothetical protein
MGQLPDQTLPLKVDDPITGDTWAVPLDVTTFMHFYNTIKNEGIERAQQIALASLQFTRHEVTEEDQRRLAAALWQVQNYPVFDREEIMLVSSYWALRQKHLTREQVAQEASTFLGKRLSTDAWRKRVDRWAEEQGYEAIGQTKRRPRKLSGQKIEELSR